jgi:hypothetical protein
MGKIKEFGFPGFLLVYLHAISISLNAGNKDVDRGICGGDCSNLLFSSDHNKKLPP